MADTPRHIDWKGLLELNNSDEALQQALISQLEKDLNQPFEDFDSQNIFESVYRSVSRLIENHRLSDLLYRVDISEKSANACMDSQDPIYALTQAILKREAQKVLFRKQYSG